MAFEWRLKTTCERKFLDTLTYIEGRMEDGVGEDGKPGKIEIKEEKSAQVEQMGPADRVRLAYAHNDVDAGLFHIRLLYGRLNKDGSFQGAMLDNGIIIGGPDYHALDTNDDGLISEDELLNMSARLLGWDGELAPIGPPEEAQA